MAQDMNHPCEQLPLELWRAWHDVMPLTQDMILAGEQHPPLAISIPAPTMAEAVCMSIRVTRALDIIQRARLGAL